MPLKRGQTTKHKKKKKKLAKVSVKDKSACSFSQNVYDELNGYCKKKAEEIGSYAHCILQERTLRELAAYLPDNLDELQGIYGIGQHKLKHFGSDIVEIIRTTSSKI